MPRLKHSQYRFRHADLLHPHPVLCTTALEAVPSRGPGEVEVVSRVLVGCVRRGAGGKRVSRVQQVFCFRLVCLDERNNNNKNTRD